jgi:hypothetical protein
MAATEFKFSGSHIDAVDGLIEAEWLGLDGGLGKRPTLMPVMVSFDRSVTYENLTIQREGFTSYRVPLHTSGDVGTFTYRQAVSGQGRGLESSVRLNLIHRRYGLR